MPDFRPRAPIATAPVSLVLVADSEARELEQVVSVWTRQLAKLKRPYEIIVVIDGVSAESNAKADALTAQFPHARVVFHPVSQGIGAGLQTGIAVAQYALLVSTICDQQYDPNDLKALLEKIDAVDLVTGYRPGWPVPGWLRGVGMVYRLLVRILIGVTLEPMPSWLGWRALCRRWLTRWLFGLRLYDVECALRLFRREIFARIPIQSASEFAHVEILAKANFLGCYMDQVTVSWRATCVRSTSFLTESFRLLQDADFGPAVLPATEPASAS